MAKIIMRLRKQGRCVCDECKKEWNYDFTYEPKPSILDLGHTNGFTRFIKCSEHNQEIMKNYLDK